jgi:hypothetical protein
MSDLTSSEKQKFERLFNIGGGYVLNFSNRIFREFVEEHARIDVDQALYQRARNFEGEAPAPFLGYRVARKEQGQPPVGDFQQRTLLVSACRRRGRIRPQGGDANSGKVAVIRMSIAELQLLSRSAFVSGASAVSTTPKRVSQYP